MNIELVKFDDWTLRLAFFDKFDNVQCRQFIQIPTYVFDVAFDQSR